MAETPKQTATGELDRPIRPDKAALIDFALRRYEVKSIVDLGACWGVNGGYTFHALREHELQRAVIVDGDITRLTRERAAKFPQVELVAGPLGEKGTAERVGAVDAAIMYDILLHQVKPDWDEFLALYSGVDTLIIFNQNWLGSDTIRFIDLGVDEYVKRVPHTDAQRVREWYARHDEMHPGHGKPWRDVHHFWQWGITQRDMIRVLWDLGYAIDYLSTFGPYDPRFPEVELVGLVAHKRDKEDRAKAGLRVQPSSTFDPRRKETEARRDVLLRRVSQLRGRRSKGT